MALDPEVALNQFLLLGAEVLRTVSVFFLKGVISTTTYLDPKPFRSNDSEPNFARCVTPIGDWRNLYNPFPLPFI